MNRVLLIGKGYWGKNWYSTLLNKQVQFAVVEPKVDGGADQNGIPFYKTLEEVNVTHYSHAIVATNAETHVKIFEHLVSKGMKPDHILLEKPCGSTWWEASKVMQCFPGYIQLHSEAFRYIHENIKQIGTPHLYKSTRGSMGPRIRNSSSVISDYLVHDLYLFMALFQPYNDIQVVSKTNMRRLNLAGYDTIFTTLYNPEVHVLADMFSSWWYPIKERRVIINGDKGSFLWINDDLYFNASRYEDYHGVDEYGNIGNKLIVAPDMKIDLPKNTPMENELDDLLTGRYAGSGIMFVEPVWELIKKIEWHTRYRY